MALPMCHRGISACCWLLILYAELTTGFYFTPCQYEDYQLLVYVEQHPTRRHDYRIYITVNLNDTLAQIEEKIHKKVPSVLNIEFGSKNETHPDKSVQIGSLVSDVDVKEGKGLLATALALSFTIPIIIADLMSFGLLALVAALNALTDFLEIITCELPFAAFTLYLTLINEWVSDSSSFNVNTEAQETLLYDLVEIACDYYKDYLLASDCGGDNGFQFCMYKMCVKGWANDNTDKIISGLNCAVGSN